VSGAVAVGLVKKKGHKITFVGPRGEKMKEGNSDKTKETLQCQLEHKQKKKSERTGARGEKKKATIHTKRRGGA